MKKIISLILCLTLLFTSFSVSAESTVTTPSSIDWSQDVKFTGMSDGNLPDYIADTVYQQLVGELDSDEYFVEDVSAIYISQEYLAEVAYNSQENIFFGYKLSDLDSYFEGTRYVFALGEDGQTTVEPLQAVKDTTYEQLLKNVAVGTGVILVCVTVSVATGGAGAPAAVHMIFAVAAKTAATCALSGSVISGVSAAFVKGYQTGDMNEALKAGALSASEGYKWGAITGAVTGAAQETWGLYSATKTGAIRDPGSAYANRNNVHGLTMNEAAQIQRETGFPLNVIKQFHTYDEYLVFKNAGLQTRMINGKLALVRTDIDLLKADEAGLTNLQRMLKGKAPLDATGHPFELHHIGQRSNGTLAILTSAEHDSASLHGYVASSEINRPEFDKIRKAFWKAMGHALKGGN